MRSTLDYLRAGLLPAAVTLLFTACGGGGSPAVEAETNPPPAATASAAPAEIVLDPAAPELQQMSIEPVRAIPIPSDEVVAPAKIEANPNRVSHAVLPVPGRIVHVMVQLGDAVTEGQPVVSIDSPTVGETQSAYLQADASVRQAELAIAKADADLARITDLYQHQAVAQKEVLAAQTTLELTKATLDQAQSARQHALRSLQLLGLKPGEFQQLVTVTAPISGKVLEISVVDGEIHNEINTSLITIADLSRVWATSDVPESDIRHCRIGGLADLELIAYPNETFRARVTRIADTVDPATRTIEVSAELDNHTGRLRPEMFGRLHYADALVPTLWIPEAAVVQANGANLVFVEQSTGRFLPVTVTLGNRYRNGFAVTAGLRAGQKVVTQGAVYLKASL